MDAPYTHTIGVVVRAPLCPTTLALKDIMEKEMQTMLQFKVIEESTSPWQSHPMLVPNVDGCVLFCIGFQTLNEVSTLNTNLMPHVDALLDRVGKVRVLATTDLTKGYWQIPFVHNTKEKTVFAIPSGC